MRIFIGINLPEKAKEAVDNVQKEIYSKGLFEGKMTEIENMHLTLKFLGEVEERDIGEISRRLENVEWDSFKADIDYLGVFDEDFIRILWLHLSRAEKLQKAIDLELVDLFNMEKRFMSHVTLWRIKKVKEKEKLLELIKTFKMESISFDVEEFYLMESKLTPKGIEYSILKRFECN